RKGALGPAIWQFERALTLDPNDDDARYNLDKARKLAARRAPDRLEGEDKDPAWIRIVGGVAPATVTWAFVALYLGFFLALMLRGEGERGGARRVQAPAPRARREGPHPRQRRRLPRPVRARRHRGRLPGAGLVRRRQGRRRPRDHRTAPDRRRSGRTPAHEVT